MKNALLKSWNMNLEYGLKLVADLQAADMVKQPAAGMNHPAWILCHLCLYHPSLLAMVNGDRCPDPGEHPDAPRYDEGSTPLPDAAQYPAMEELVARFRRGHEDIATSLERMPAVRPAETPPLDRWVPVFGTTGSVLSYLMLTHESVHLGQISAWRRAMGLPRV